MSFIIEFQVIKFLWFNIFSQYGVPRILISDNIPYFWERTQVVMRRAKHRPLIQLGTPPQAKTTKKVILTKLKMRVTTPKINWVEELDNILWAIRTTFNGGTSEIDL